MELVGVYFYDPLPPLPTGFFPLGPVSAVIGANDTGKSRLLSHLAAELSLGDSTEGEFDAVFFLRLAESEMQQMEDVRWSAIGRITERLRKDGTALTKALSKSQTVAVSHGGWDIEDSWTITLCLEKRPSSRLGHTVWLHRLTGLEDRRSELLPV